MGRRILVTWVGWADLAGMAVRLPEPMRDQALELLDPPLTKKTMPVGPTQTLLDHETFDEIHLLNNYDPWLGKRFADALKGDTHLRNVSLTDPTDYDEIFRIADTTLAEILGRQPRGTELAIHLSPGTPTMTAVWVLLGKSKYPATFFQTFQGAATETRIPYDLVDEFVPEVLRNPDLNLQHLASRLPGELRGFGGVVGESKAIRLAVGWANQMAKRSVNVLIQGETGTGKELFARAIHDAGPRANGPFVAVNCAAVPPKKLESVLFGHRKGGIPEAPPDRRGAFAEADGGTLFLDEIGECPLEIQSKLLEVLQPAEGQKTTHRTFRPVWAGTDETADVRVITATNRSLLDGGPDRPFREELYYRLAVLVLNLPPLRERKADIPPLARHFLEEVNRQFRDEEPGYVPKTLSDRGVRLLKEYAWPGNVRELSNVLVQAAVMAPEETIESEHLAAVLAARPGEPALPEFLQIPDGEFDLTDHLRSVERHYVVQALRVEAGTQARAARLLGLNSPQALAKKMSKLGITARDWGG